MRLKDQSQMNTDFHRNKGRTFNLEKVSGYTIPFQRTPTNVIQPLDRQHRYFPPEIQIRNRASLTGKQCPSRDRPADLAEKRTGIAPRLLLNRCRTSRSTDGAARRHLAARAIPVFFPTALCLLPEFDRRQFRPVCQRS